ncbi:hypothetical protein [Streptomyces cadmiisoli]|uniref:hypothetical protein n=1 Tax=Streptomyces cadmiisoli TaxID=2184053 RepID=UPI001FE2C450|nr:hypothetical protein [Streptomyces cadmiisoli]
MTRGGRHATAVALVSALLAGAPLGGCAGADGARDETRTSAAPPAEPPSPSATPPEELCAQIVAHWSREVLDEDTYGDYQSMGLSNGQYEILMDVVDAARAEKDHEGDAAARELIDRRAGDRCAERYRDGGPTAGPWS